MLARIKPSSWLSSCVQFKQASLIHLESLQGTRPPRPGVFCISKNASITRPPQAARADCELKSFLDWFQGARKIDPVLRAGLAYLGFVTIHPFDDGNGRIARAIADMALARSENSLQRLYSASARIRQERNRCRRRARDAADAPCGALAAS